MIVGSCITANRVCTTFVNNLNATMKNVRSGTKNFDEDMEALKHNILLRNYFGCK